MASQLTERDKQLLDGDNISRVGSYAYEDGYWGSQGYKDFVHFQILDTNRNLIQYDNLPISEFLLSGDNVQFYPGKHIRSLGFETGTFIVRYNFLRKLAGDESSVLVRTVDKGDTRVGDLYQDLNDIYITEDGIIYTGTEEAFLNSPNNSEQLRIEDLKYQIDEISPSRTEVRLRAKHINSSYIDDFVNVQTSIKTELTEDDISFNQNAGNYIDSLSLTVDGEFSFTPKMIDGTLTIPDVYKINEVEIPATTGQNAIQNPNAEELELDSLGNVLKIGATKGWDESLHSDAVRVKNWSSGFNSFSGDSHAAIGYHAKWVQGEGVNGGTCIKFPDTNALFTDLDEWDYLRSDGSKNPNRWLGVSQTMRSLSQEGVKSFDIANIRVDVKSTVVGKGVKLNLYYPYEINEEPNPSPEKPEGYYDITSPGATEAIPDALTNLGNTAEDHIIQATNIEPSPASTLIGLLNQYPHINPANGGNGFTRNSDSPRDGEEPQIGDTTENTTIDGEGAWRIAEIQESTESEGEFIYYWEPNTFHPNVGASYNQNAEGTLSPEGQWVWNGDIWEQHPDYADIPQPPVGSTNVEGAVNYHPYQNQVGNPKFKRKTYPGENRGWDTGTTIFGGDTGTDDAFEDIGVDSSHITDNAFILLKDDLVWYMGNSNLGNSDEIYLFTIDQVFPNLRAQTITYENEDGESITHSIYKDIFEKGKIQSITRTKRYGEGQGNSDKVEENVFVLFYNDGRGTDESNKVLQVKVDGNVAWYNLYGTVKFLKDLDAQFNQVVMDAGGKMEWAFAGEKRSSPNWEHVVCVKHTGKIWNFFEKQNSSFFSLNGADGGWFEEGSGELHSFINRFGISNLTSGRYFDVWFSAKAVNSHWSNWSGIFNSRQPDGGIWVNFEDNTALPVEESFNVTDWAYNAGVVGTAGRNLTYGVRNSAADNFGPHDEDGNVVGIVLGEDFAFGTLTEQYPVYDNGTAVFSFDINPSQKGATTPKGQWEWDGSQWNRTDKRPGYKRKGIYPTLFPQIAGKWETLEASVTIPNDWILEGEWHLYVYGHEAGTDVASGKKQGITWADNMYMDFTLVDQSVTQEVYRPYSSKIVEVVNESTIKVEQSLKEVGSQIGAIDADEDSQPDIYDVDGTAGSFERFRVSYTNLNPKDLRTYLKFGNDLFLTTNFKQDKINVSNYPHGVVYKLYEPLPDDYVKFNECIIVKEMMNPLEETISIIDFVPEEDPQLVLRSPNLSDVESPVKRKTTGYKSEDGILTTDSSISTELRNEFLSQSLDSVEINTDYSRYKNFINFSSAEKRIRNFKLKLENIEDYKVSSASYVGVSGSSTDLNKYHNLILDTENKLDDFERYMYFESSSFSTSSLGVFYDNAWPKASGEGTFSSKYVLATTTSAQGKTWFSNSTTSASAYDLENNSKLSDILPEHIKFDNQNFEYLHFTDMVGQHFDKIWEYINALSDTFDRRDKLDEGLSKDLLHSVGRSLGWNLDDGKDLIELPRYALGKEVTGSAYSDHSATSERDISREIWGRIINNMPFFLKNKGTVRALKGLINIYGIPSTILRVKEYGGPKISDDESPQYEITRKFTKALDFRGAQSIKVAWANDSSTSRKPDTIEFRFRAATGSNQILVEKQDNNNQDFFIRLKDNGSSDNYGYVSFMLSGSAVGQDIGQYKELLSSELPVYDGDFYSVMVNRTSGSSNTSISQSYNLNVGKYDESRHKIHLYSTSTMDVTQAASSSFSNAWTGSGEIYIGGSGSAGVADVGVAFSGSIMEYRNWTEVLNTGSFKNHIANPKAYDGNSVSSSYENLVLRYSMNDNKDLSSDTEGIRDVSSNQTSTLSGSHSGFTGNFFRSVVDEQKTHIPSIGGLRRSTDKIRIENNDLKSGYSLNPDRRSTKSAYDTAPNDSNKVGIWFAPTDVINNDIINSVGDLNFEDYLGDPRDKTELSYRGLNYVADNYWKKYTAPNNFWDYMRLLKYYDQSLYPQLRKLIPARAKPDIGLFIEPNIFERPKVVVGKTVDLENTYYSSSVDVTKEVISITGSYNQGSSISDYDSYTGKINMYSYETGSSVVSSSGEYSTFEASGSEINNRSYELSIWQTLGTGNYKSASIEKGDVKYNEVHQPIITGSRIYGVNKKTTNFYTSSVDAVKFNENSSSFSDVDLDNYSNLFQGLKNSFYLGVKNTIKTTSDGKPPVELIISAPTKLVTTDEGDSPLKTGDGIVPDFKEPTNLEEQQTLQGDQPAQEEPDKPIKKGGLKGLTETPISDNDIIKKNAFEAFQKELKAGLVMSEETKTVNVDGVNNMEK